MVAEVPVLITPAKVKVGVAPPRAKVTSAKVAVVADKMKVKMLLTVDLVVVLVRQVM